MRTSTSRYQHRYVCAGKVVKNKPIPKVMKNKPIRDSIPPPPPHVIFDIVVFHYCLFYPITSRQ